MNQAQEDTKDRELYTERLYAAPRQLVFEAWTTPEHLGEWFGPDGFTITTREMRFEPGGRWVFVMHGPDGTDYDNQVDFLEIVPPERLVYDHGQPEKPGMFRVTVEFLERGAKTELRMRMVFKTREERDERVEKSGAIEGQRQTLDRLGAYLERRRNEGRAS